MPPKKEVKEKQVKGDEAEELVLQYLKSVNRPYAATDVSANLKNKVPKAAAQKILAALADKGSLTCKTYGKQLIYVYKQSQLVVASADDLASLEEERKATLQEVEEQRKQLKNLTAELTALNDLPKTKNVNAEIERIVAENETTLKALLPYRGDGEGEKVSPLSDEEIKTIDANFVRWRKQWVERRKIYKEFVSQAQEADQIVSLPSFEEDNGINVDEDDAKEVENGEFCKPQAPFRASRPMKKAAPPKAPTVVSSKPPASHKRADTDSTVGEEAPPKKKKAKKA